MYTANEKRQRAIEYVILGTSHLVQESVELEESVVRVLSQFRIRVVAEENSYDIASTAGRRVSKRLGLSYIQIDPSPSEWAELGIDREMSIRGQSPDRRDVRLSHADDVREKVWLDRIAASTTGARVLVVCGYLHVDYLAQKVEERGGTVVERLAFPGELLCRKPDMVLSPTELNEYMRKRLEVGWGADGPPLAN